MRKILYYGLGLLILLPMAVRAEAQVAQEYQIKAAFLYNFANFFSWPESAFDSPEAPLWICVIGTDPFRSVLDITTENITAKGRKLSVGRYQSIADLRAAPLCHILFISPLPGMSVRQVTDAIADRPILTVGEDDDFLCQGGMIRFVRHGKKVRLAINEERLNVVKLKADANLLRLAELKTDQDCR